MPEPRLLIETNLTAGARVALDEAQARHVGLVLRLDVDDWVRVFNGEDGEWRARIVEKSKRGVTLAVEEKLRAARAVPDLDLLFAPVKRHATDLIVEKATELGVRRIRPVITSRTVAETVRLDRLNAIAREAAEQTERFDAPEIFEPVSLPRALDGWDASRRLIYCDEEGEAAGILEAVTQFTPSPKKHSLGEGAGGGATHDVGPVVMSQPSRPQTSSLTPPPNPLPSRGGGVSLLIGPEGGFTADERRMLRACAFVTPVSLGPRILRAETAVIAALTIVQAAWGDWR